MGQRALEAKGALDGQGDTGDFSGLLASASPLARQGDPLDEGRVVLLVGEHALPAVDGVDPVPAGPTQLTPGHPWHISILRQPTSRGNDVAP